MAKFVTIGERLSTTAPAVNKAFMERDPEPILKRAKQQLDAGAVYLCACPECRHRRHHGAGQRAVYRRGGAHPV